MSVPFFLCVCVCERENFTIPLTTVLHSCHFTFENKHIAVNITDTKEIEDEDLSWNADGENSISSCSRSNTLNPRCENKSVKSHLGCSIVTFDSKNSIRCHLNHFIFSINKWFYRNHKDKSIGMSKQEKNMSSKADKRFFVQMKRKTIVRIFKWEITGDKPTKSPFRYILITIRQF